MNETIISEVAFYPLRPSPKGLIGIASCLFDNKLSLNSISIYSTPSGDIRLLFPDKVLPNSRKIHIFYPINNETYEVIKQAIRGKIENVNGYDLRPQAIIEQLDLRKPQFEKTARWGHFGNGFGWDV